MPGLDWIPGISQLKSGFQLITGDPEGAARTIANFVQECPGFSQATSVVQLIAGDEKGALETQKKCLGTLNNVANGIPVVGHIKGVVHYAVGDEAGGDHAMNAASRSAVVLGSGAGAALLSGGLAAIPAGIAAGAAYDTAGTLITGKPQGWYAAIGNACENPNAGNIFEAAFVPVGDGLGGYAGGKLATSIATRVKISNLEAIRDGKMAVIDEATFGAGEATSAQVVELGNQINALTSQINLLKHGTTQFWFDPKTGEIFTTKPTNGAIAVPGYINEKDEKKLKNKIKDMYNQQSDGILSDNYAQQLAGNCNTRILKQNRCTDRENQQAQGDLTAAYPNIPIFTEGEINQLKRDQQDPNKQNNRILLQALSWLHVPMPSQFNYTGAILRNNSRQGLLHSFLRHSGEWKNVINGLSADIENIPSINRDLQNIEGATNFEEAGRLLNTFAQTLQNLSNDDREALSDIQMRLYKFLNANITYANYLGEGVNDAGRIRVFFRVKDNQGKYQVMVVCVSDQLYRNHDDIPDSRRIRTITTIFFISESKARIQLIKKMF